MRGCGAADRMFVPLTGQRRRHLVLPKFPANQKVKAEIVYKWPLKPPLKKGDQVADLAHHHVHRGDQRGAAGDRRGRGEEAG